MKIAVVNAHVSRTVGGSERQCDLLADELARRGHAVHYVAVGGADIGTATPSYSIVECGNSAREISRCCASLSPDVVYWRYNKRCFFNSARVLSRRGIPIVFAVSHVADTQKWSSKLDWADVAGVRGCARILKSRLMSRWDYMGFRYVDSVVVNNPEHVGRLPVRVQTHIDNSMGDRAASCESAAWPRPYCLWVANLKPQKRPECALELARQIKPDGVDLLMIGEVQSATYAGFGTHAAGVENLQYLGARSEADVQRFIAGALLLVHTCKPEGFPNIFIQAWAAGKPVVSLDFDPGRVLQEVGVGVCSGSEKAFAADVRRLIERSSEREIMGLRGKQLVEERFSLQRNASRLEAFLERTVRTGGRSSSMGAQPV